MEGFMHWRIKPWVRRLITRTLAILPAVFIIGLRGDSSVTDLLTLSQVVLALQLPFAMFPLLHFTSSRKRMGDLEERLVSAGRRLGQCYPDHRHGHLRPARLAESGVAGHRRRVMPRQNGTTMYDTILVTLDGTPTDRAIIEHIKELAKLAHSRLVLLHVADGWAARTYGPDAVSPEIAEDTAYLQRVRAEFQAAGIPAEAELAYGDPVKRNRQVGAAERLRPGRHEHPRTPLSCRHLSRHHRQLGAAQYQRAGSSAPGKVKPCMENR